MQLTLAQTLSLLSVRIKLSLAGEARRSQLSYMWWVGEPALEAAVFFVVFGVVLNQGVENFVVFLLTGLIPFTWFSRSVTNSMDSMKHAKVFLDNFRIHPIFFPLVHVGQDAVKQLFSFGCLLFFLLAYGAPVHATWLLLPIIMLMQLCFVGSVCTLVASVLPVMEDLRYLVTTSIMCLMFASGIFYDVNTVVTAKWTLVFYFNPVAALINIYRDSLMGGVFPDAANVLTVAVWTALCCILTYLSMSKWKGDYARIISQ